MSEDETSQREPPPRQVVRKPYRAPRLARLGTLTELTENIGSSAMNNDSASHTDAFHKTA